jgi:GNAT superfamily N-acetyltransferase
MRIEATTCAALFGAAGFDDLVAEYAIEAKVEGLPEPAVKLATYEVLEQSGVIHPFGAFIDDRLVGFLAVLSTMVPHYPVPLTCTETFFVTRDARSSGAGLALLKAAEAKARELGAGGLLVSAPCGGALAAVLPRYGYRDANRVFFKRFSDTHDVSVIDA